MTIISVGSIVCAVDFSCLSELLEHGVNGFVFKDADQLQSQLCKLLRGFPWSDKETSANNQSPLLKVRENLRRFKKMKWHDTWVDVALPLIKKRDA